MQPARPPLTLRQQAILDYLRTSLLAGRNPSVREICERFGFASYNSVTGFFKALEKKGYILRPRKLARSVQLINERPAVVTAGLASIPSSEYVEPLQRCARDDAAQISATQLAYLVAKQLVCPESRRPTVVGELVLEILVQFERLAAVKGTDT